MKQVLFSFFLCILLAYSALSQNNIHGSLVSAYQESTNSSYSIQWSIGDLLPETFTINDLALSGGLSENIVFNITGVSPEVSSPKSVTIFPNPFSKTLVAECEEIPLNESTFEFYNAIGKRQRVSVIERQKTSVHFLTEDLPPGLYILEIRNIALNYLTHIKVIHE